MSSLLSWPPSSQQPSSYSLILSLTVLDSSYNWYDVVFVPEKAMAPHSSTLAWKIPWMEEPGRLQSMGSLRVGHDWETSLSLFTFMHWRRKWQPTPVFLPGGSQGQGSLVGCRLWGRTELDTTEAAAAVVFVLLSIMSSMFIHVVTNNSINYYQITSSKISVDFILAAYLNLD